MAHSREPPQRGAPRSASVCLGGGMRLRTFMRTFVLFVFGASARAAFPTTVEEKVISDDDAKSVAKWVFLVLKDIPLCMGTIAHAQDSAALPLRSPAPRAATSRSYGASPEPRGLAGRAHRAVSAAAGLPAESRHDEGARVTSIPTRIACCSPASGRQASQSFPSRRGSFTACSPAKGCVATRRVRSGGRSSTWSAARSAST